MLEILGYRKQDKKPEFDQHNRANLVLNK